MSIYQQWLDQADQEFTQEAYDAFWESYLVNEKGNYEQILESKNTSLKGKVADLAESFTMDLPTFAGFLDGINTSLTEELDLESLTEATEIDATIEWEKLYFNMHKAKADWLYSLPQWDEILTQDQRKSIKKAYNKTTIVVNDNKVGRNDPCPCGSGKKYKKCCINA